MAACNFGSRLNWPKFLNFMFVYVFYVCFKLFISNILCRSDTRMFNSLVSTEQLAKILDQKLEQAKAFPIYILC